MANPRKYDLSSVPAVGGAVEFLDNLQEGLRNMGQEHLAEECKKKASVLYDYISRTMYRRGGQSNETKNRNLTIMLRGYQKRISQLEEKLLLIRCSTDLFERGNRTSDNGSGNRCQRQARRIDHLEAKLLIIRELADTNEAVKGHMPSKVGAPARQIHDQRIRVDIEKGLHGRRKPVVNPEKGNLLKAHLEEDNEDV